MSKGFERLIGMMATAAAISIIIGNPKSLRTFTALGDSVNRPLYPLGLGSFAEAEDDAYDAIEHFAVYGVI